MGSTIARNTAIFLLVAAVPALLAVPAAMCRPVGGELPGINCLAPAALLVIGTCLFAFILGLSVDRVRRFGGGRSATLAIAALAGGWLVGLGLLYARPNDWVPRDLLRLPPWTVIGPLIAFGIGWLLRVLAATASRARRKPRPDSSEAFDGGTRAGGSR